MFPKNAKAPKKGDSTAEECAAATQLKGELIPITQVCVKEAPRKVTEAEKAFNAFATLRKAHNKERLAGIRAKRALIKAEEEAAKKK